MFEAVHNRPWQVVRLSRDHINKLVNRTILLKLERKCHNLNGSSEKFIILSDVKVRPIDKTSIGTFLGIRIKLDLEHFP